MSEVDEPFTSCQTMMTSSTKEAGSHRLHSKDKDFSGKMHRSLKRKHLVPDDADAAAKPTRKRDKKQSTLLEIPLVPKQKPQTDDAPAFLNQLRAMAKRMTLMMILDPIHYMIDMNILQAIMDMIAINMKTPEWRDTIRSFLEAAVQASNLQSEVQYLQQSTVIRSDRIWSTTCCGIVTMRNVTEWLNNSIKKTVPDACSVTQSIHNPSSTSSATMTSKDSDTYTYSTTADGYPENAIARGLTGTQDQTLTGGLLSHIKSRVATGCASSVIYLSDDGSYKFA